MKELMKTKADAAVTTRREPSWLRLSKSKPGPLVGEAIVDCYNESEQVSGPYTMIEENLHVPFETEVLGVPVTVTGVDIPEDHQIVAICKRGTFRQKIPILELPLPRPRPAGSEWIEAYRHWARGGY